MNSGYIGKNGAYVENTNEQYLLGNGNVAVSGDDYITSQNAVADDEAALLNYQGANTGGY